MSARSLATVARAAERKRHAQAAYRDAIREARAQGASVHEIASAAGIARQNVYKLLRRNP